MTRPSPSRTLQGTPQTPGPDTQEQPLLNIGGAARSSGVSAKMIRHYESLGLLPSIGRTASGYRLYTARDIHTLRFIRRCRDLGFSMAEIAELLSLWRDQQRASAQVRHIAANHIEDLKQRIASLESMKQTLEHLVSCCHGNQRPECPILDDLAGNHQISAENSMISMS